MTSLIASVARSRAGRARGRSTTRLWASALVATLVWPVGAAAQGDTGSSVDPWEPLRLLVGTWEAGIDGALGQGKGLRAYEFVIDDRYLLHRHASVRLPQPDSPEGDHHRELAIYSFDRERDTIVLREFMVERFVLTSTCETEPRRVVCTTERVESGAGMRARLTIDIESPYLFRETFELADVGAELELLFENTWTRVPAID